MKGLFAILFLFCSGVCLGQKYAVLANTSFTGFHCDGKQGICDIDNANDRSQSNTEIVLNENRTLTFKIERTKLSPDNVKSITGKTSLTKEKKDEHYFVVDEEFILPTAITKALDQETKPLRIKMGSYPVQVSDQFFTITFTLE